jgi:cell division protein FtsB
MAAGPRSTSRPGAGPGRGKPRVRNQARGAAAGSPPSSEKQDNPGQPPASANNRQRTSFTARAIALAVVLLILTISYATSLRIYFAQAHEIAATQAEIAQRQQRIDDLQTEMTRWQDPDYVRIQARERLGWVMPGETGYRVVGPDGKPLGGGAEITAQNKTEAPAPVAWWAKLWGSVEAADKPAPPKPKAREPKPITPDTKPNNATPTPTPTPTVTPR